MKKATPLAPPISDGDGATRLAVVKGAATAAARANGYPAPHLIAISKTFTAPEIRPLLEAGHRRFGENRVQEAAGKWPELKQHYPDIELHMVGSLQSNKAAEAVALFDAIHSVDRPSLIKALASAIAAQGRTPTLFIQVDLEGETQKGGVSLKDMPALLAQAHDAGLVIRGLMTVPPVDKEPAPYFALLKKVANEHALPFLSMGMSGDYDVAAALGATHIRIGTALFGSR